jgi:glycosyltransferase involved in cell wall biosynthesis
MDTPLNILMVARSNLFALPGGDTLQVEQTMRHLESRGHQVALHLKTTRVDDAPYDVIHHFNLGRPEDHLPLLRRWKKPVVLSTNYVDYSEYESRQDMPFPRNLLQQLSPPARERVKAMGRRLASGRLPSYTSLRHSHTAALQRTLQRAAATITTSAAEATRIERTLDPLRNNHIIPLGVDHALFHEAHHARSGVVIAGRIEGLKNQLTALQALKNRAIPVTVAGEASTNHQAYYKECLHAGAGWATFLPHQSPKALAELFQRAQVVLIPSWFETFGLVAAEAGFSGARVVLTERADTYSDWKHLVWGCDPGHPESIARAVSEALNAPKTPSWESLKSRLNWDTVAASTEAVYRSVIAS